MRLLRMREKSTFSDRQRTTLEQAYRCKPYVDYQRRMELALDIGLSEEQVRIWFQNRRAKDRQVAKRRTEPSDRLYSHKPNNHWTRTFERYSAYQRSQLEQAYQRSRFISYEQKDQLAHSLGLSKNQIQFWFQNRRSKEKKLLQKHKFPSHFGR
ncbi:hypothetical protein HPB47_000882 [Ixodes persulcatus]|uniref:Uncharacterized protein n=1 Tax=Ixodes persulcatus TaxID=34615 RepID=A0AC60PQN8_IXOPE|nr:hypothetical protein HPB47_000882 [Ixodes persulcatus]